MKQDVLFSLIMPDGRSFDLVATGDLGECDNPVLLFSRLKNNAVKGVLDALTQISVDVRYKTDADRAQEQSLPGLLEKLKS